MEKLKTELFLGISFTSEIQERIKMLDPYLVSMFLAQDSEHLQQYRHEGRDFLGKPLGELADSSTVLLVGTHIISVIKKLLPDYRVDINSLVILPFQGHESERQS